MTGMIDPTLILLFFYIPWYNNFRYCSFKVLHPINETRISELIRLYRTSGRICAHATKYNEHNQHYEDISQIVPEFITILNIPDCKSLLEGRTVFFYVLF